MDSVRNLKISFDSKLCFDLHIDNIISKGLRKLNFIKSCIFNFSSSRCLKILYVYMPYVLGHLTMRVTTKKLELDQRNFLRYPAFELIVNDISDVYLLRLLNLLLLEVCRLQRDIEIFYKLLCGNLQYCIDLLESIPIHVPTPSVPFYRTNYNVNSFLIRSASLADHFCS